MKRGTIYLIVMSIVMVLLVVISMSWQIEPPNPPPNIDDSNNPPITVKTTVKIHTYWISNPYIADISNEIVGINAELPQKSKLDISVAWFGFKGKLKLTVIAPDGKTYDIGTKDINQDPFTDKEYTFVWATKQRGTHTVIATLYNDKGEVVDEKEVTVDVGSPTIGGGFG